MAILAAFTLTIYVLKSLQLPHAHDVGAAISHPSDDLLCTWKMIHWISGRIFGDAERGKSHKRAIYDAVAPASWLADVVRMHAPADAVKKRGHARTRTIPGISVVGSDHERPPKLKAALLIALLGGLCMCMLHNAKHIRLYCYGLRGYGTCTELPHRVDPLQYHMGTLGRI